MKTLINANKTTCETTVNKIKQIKQFTIFCIFHQITYGRVQKIITRPQQILENRNILIQLIENRTETNSNILIQLIENGTETKLLTKTNLATAKSKPCGVSSSRTGTRSHNQLCNEQGAKEANHGRIQRSWRLQRAARQTRSRKKGPRAGALRCRRQNPTPRIPGRQEKRLRTEAGRTDQNASRRLQ
jgi:hypothetical protein